MDIRFSKVSKHFGALSVLSDFSYTFRDGQTYCLMGPSGCGKSTLLRLACGLLPPDDGNLAGQAQRFSVVFQDNRLLPWYSARENLAIALRRGTSEEWIRQIGLSAFADARPGDLSGGMCRRLAIARALAADGDAYLFDEPFSGLDADNRRKMLHLIRISTEGKLCLFVTHSAEEACEIGGACLSFSGPPLRLC